MKKRQDRKPNQQAPEPEAPRVTASWEGLLERHETGAVVALVLGLLLVVFRHYIFGDRFYLFLDSGMDSFIECYPNLMQAGRYLWSFSLPVWSFTQGMGQNIMAKSLADPFYLICYLAGPTGLAYMLVWMEAAKILATAFVFFRFLKLWDLSGATAAAGTLLYCFSGFMIVGGEWYVFSTEACYLALLLLGFEKLYRHGDWRIFPVPVALIAFQRPFDLYMISGLFLGPYFLFRHFLSEDRSPARLLKVAAAMVACGALGIVMGGFNFVANCQLILDSPRVSGSYSMFGKLASMSVFSLDEARYYLTALTRFFSNDLAGNARTYSGWRNYLEAPLFYLGLLPLVLAPQTFVSAGMRKKAVYGLFILLFALPAVFPFIRYAAFLFTGNYFRILSLFLSLTLLFAALDALDGLDKGRALSRPVLLGTAAALVGLLFLPDLFLRGEADPVGPLGGLTIDAGLRIKAAAFILAYAALFLSHGYVKEKGALRPLLILLVVLELVVMNEATLGDRLTVSRQGLTDYAKDAVNHVGAADKGFFRVSKLFSSGPSDMPPYNESQVLGYFGTMSYDSFNQKYYLRFLSGLNLIEGGVETQGRYLVGLGNSPLLWPWASIRYHLSTGRDAEAMALGYAPAARIGGVIVYRNAHALPLGFTYNRYLPLSTFEKLPAGVKPFALLKAVVAEEPVSPEIRTRMAQLDLRELEGGVNLQSYAKAVDGLGRETLKMGMFTENALEGTVEVTSPRVLFFSIPYDRGWHGEVDGKRVEPLLTNLGFMGFPLNPGGHRVRLFYQPAFFHAGLAATVLGIAAYFFLAFSRRFNERVKRVLAGRPADDQG